MRSAVRTALITFLTLTLFAFPLAQSPIPKKKIKHFGSSLKRLKWNPQKNATVDSRSNPNSDAGDVIRIDTTLVTCELLVLDRHGQNVSGLTASDLSISEDGQPQTVAHFLTGDNSKVPRTIVLIIDYSGSQRPYLQNSVAAAKVLVDKLGPNDRMAIVTDDVELLIDFTDDKKKLANKLESLLNRIEPSRAAFGPGYRSRVGRSKQYSSLMATLNEAFDDNDVRPIIIFQTDGDEALFLRNAVTTLTVAPDLQGDDLIAAQRNLERQQKVIREGMTEFSLDDIYHAVESSRATIYTVVPGIKLIGLGPEQRVERVMVDLHDRGAEMLTGAPPERRDKMKTLLERYEKGFTPAQYSWSAEHRFSLQSALVPVAALTGGWTEFLEKPEQAHDIYARIFSDINQRYIVGYYPSNKERDGKRRKIDFEVKGHANYQIYGRRSYFAPEP